jgi:hypothetical protein
VYVCALDSEGMMRGETFVSLWCVFWCRTVGVCVGWKCEVLEERRKE